MYRRLSCAILVLVLSSCDFSQKTTGKATESSTVSCPVGFARDSFLRKLNRIARGYELPFYLRKDTADGAYFLSIIGDQTGSNVVLIGIPESIGLSVYVSDVSAVKQDLIMKIYGTALSLAGECGREKK